MEDLGVWEDNTKIDLQEMRYGDRDGSLKVTYRPKHVGPENKLNSKCIVIKSCVIIWLYYKVNQRYSKLGNVLFESNDFSFVAPSWFIVRRRSVCVEPGHKLW